MDQFDDINDDIVSQGELDDINNDSIEFVEPKPKGRGGRKTKKDSIRKIVKGGKIKLPSKPPTVYKTSQRAYLELIENKDVVVPDKLNKEFIFKSDNTIDTPVFNPVKDDIDDDRSYNNDKSDIGDKVLRGEYDDQSDDNASAYNYSDNEAKQPSEHGAVYISTTTSVKKDYSSDTEKKEKPSLSDMNIPHQDASGINLEVNKSDLEIENEKRTMLYKIEHLRRIYGQDKTTQFANLNMFSSHSLIKTELEAYRRSKTIENSTKSYKNFLMFGFMIIEAASNIFIGIDMAGFTQSQVEQMDQYEELLFELSEETYTPKGKESWPVMVRLLFMIGSQTVLFAGINYATKKIDSGNKGNGDMINIIMNLFNNFSSAKNGNRSKDMFDTGKPTMDGPIKIV